MEYEDITSQPLEFFGGNVCLPVKLTLPRHVLYKNLEFNAKTEFHCSLICVKCIVKELVDKHGREASPLLRQILSKIEIVRQQGDPVFLGYKNELRHVTKEDNQSIVILVDIGRLEPLFERLRNKYQLNIPSQPTHVTLYTLIPDKGIGIYSAEELETTDLIKGAELNRLKQAMDFETAFRQNLI